MTDYGRQFLSEAEINDLPFAARGRNALIHARVNLVNVENISFGKNVRIDGDVTILATGRVHIGDYVHIGAQCYLAGAAGLEMHDFSGLSQGVKIYTSSDDYSGEHLTNPTVPKEFLGTQEGRVVLGRHVIIGAGSVILPGVTVAEGCSIGALSLVRATTEPWGIYSGIPARRRIERSRNLLQLERRLLQQP